MERTSRAQKYQYVFHEQVYSPEQWRVIESLPFYDQLNETRQQVEQLWDLDSQLHSELWALLYLTATPLQLMIAQQVYLGKTQIEISRMLGQKSKNENIHKALRGNTEYKSGEARKYGGLANKISKYLKQSPSIQRLMRVMYELDPSGFTPHYTTFRRTFDNWQHFTSWLTSDLENHD